MISLTKFICHCWISMRKTSINKKKNALIRDNKTLTSGSLFPKNWSDEIALAFPNFFCASCESDTSYDFLDLPLNYSNEKVSHINFCQTKGQWHYFQGDRGILPHFFGRITQFPCWGGSSPDPFFSTEDIKLLQ